MEWIACSKFLPKSGKTVFVFMDGDIEFAQYRERESEWFIYTSGAFKAKYEPCELTHWMPLPAPPTE